MNTSTMQAVGYDTYGPPEVLQLRRMTKPTPKPDEVLIKIHATTVTSGDWRLRKADPFMARLFTGLIKPKNPILGHELSGDVEAIGTAVTKFKVGDKVFASTAMSSGTYAEYICRPENSALAIMPAHLSYEAAAAIPVGALTALHLIREGNIQTGQQVLIYGASGSVGSFAVQLAKYYGATVTAVCSTANVAMVKALGADRVIDYKKTDLTKSMERYDMVFDAVGFMPFASAKKVLTPEGCYVSVAWGLSLMATQLVNSVMGSHKIVIGMSKNEPEDMVFLAELAEAGQLKPAIDRRYKLSEVAEAHRYVEAGHKKGNVVVLVA
jgi:NADPH:quinone reductase-like Zn-dependent oxidoreductase